MNSKILIVDDNPKNIQVLGNILSENEYEIEVAMNGKDALDILKESQFDLVLLDIMMPEMNGYEVCTIIRGEEKNRNLPVIFLTAKTDPESIVHSFKVGGQDYITKPFNTPELLVRVETQIELKKSREKLESLNNWLQSEVQKRTFELEESNSNLEKANTHLEAANKELMGLDKAKTDFLSVISNEMRPPLNGILGTLHILKEKVDSKEIVNLIQVLDSSVNKLERFSSYALLITSLKTKKHQLNIQEIKISSLIEFCIIELSKNIKEQKVNIENNITSGDEIKGDYDLLVTAFTKILDSGLMRTPKGGRIQINLHKELNQPIIEIKDQGNGFSQDFIDQKFELMDSEDSSLDELGLDLNLVKLIIEAHKGKIELKNNNTGSSINIILNQSDPI